MISGAPRARAKSGDEAEVPVVEPGAAPSAAPEGAPAAAVAEAEAEAPASERISEPTSSPGSSETGKSSSVPARKPQLGIVVLGHVDCGKSTTTGHLVYKCGGVNEETMSKYGEEAASIGKGSFKYAWVVDTMKAERERGITIEVTTKTLQTPKFTMTLIDTPGHRDFMKNTIAGITQADVGLLVVSAALGEFEVGVNSDVGQTREQVVLARMMGNKQYVVAVNKMDTVGYKVERFMEIKKAMEEHLAEAGVRMKLSDGTATVQFVPISGFHGDNLIDKSAKMPWYSGPPLLQALDSFSPPRRDHGKPLRIPLTDVYKVAGVGTVPVGRIATGTLKPGIKVQFAPGGACGEVVTVNRLKEEVPEAVSGDSIGFHVAGVEVRELRRGFVASDASNRPAHGVASFDAEIIVIGHSKISPGYTPVVDCHTAHIACRIDKIHRTVDRTTRKTLEENPEFVKTGDSCIVTLIPTRPMCVETFKEFPVLGRFVIRDMRRVVAAGVVKSTVANLVAKAPVLNKAGRGSDAPGPGTGKKP